jgi:hypothetical protein
MNLKIKCLFTFHNWDWSKEDIHEWKSKRPSAEALMRSMKKVSALSIHIAELTPVRICQNFYKKQRYMNNQGWVDWDELTKEELRDKKLNQLGI